MQTLVFGWLENPNATLEELSQTSAALGVEITPQGLDKRFTEKAANFIKRILEAAVSIVITVSTSIPIVERAVALPRLMERFNGVYIQDSSIIVLPDELGEIFQGCGGSSQQNTASSR